MGELVQLFVGGGRDAQDLGHRPLLGLFTAPLGVVSHLLIEDPGLVLSAVLVPLILTGLCHVLGLRPSFKRCLLPLSLLLQKDVFRSRMSQEREFPGGPVVHTLPLMQGVGVGSLVRELDPTWASCTGQRRSLVRQINFKKRKKLSLRRHDLMKSRAHVKKLIFFFLFF